MSFTRTMYDNCQSTNRCNEPLQPGNYMLNKTFWENSNVCTNNTNVDLNYFNNSIGNRTDLESELRSLNQQLGNCSVNKQKTCLEDSSQPICNIKPAISNICDRYITCPSLSHPNKTDCFGMNANLNCQ